MKGPGLGEERGFTPRRQTGGLREERSRGERRAQAEELRTPGARQHTRLPRASHLALARVPGWGTSPSRGEVPRVASAPASVAGWVARRPQTRVVPPESAEDGTDRHFRGPGLRGGRRTPFSCSLPVAFYKKYSSVPRGCAQGAPGTQPCSSVPARPDGPAPNQPGQGTRGSAPGRTYFLGPERGGFIQALSPSHFSRVCPLPPPSFRS